MPCLTGVKTQRLLNDCAWHTGGVRVSDIVTTPVRLGAAIHNRRVFHPVGVAAEGILERVAPSSEGLPMASCDVIGQGVQGHRPARRITRHRGLCVAYATSTGSA